MTFVNYNSNFAGRSIFGPRGDKFSSRNFAHGSRYHRGTYIKILHILRTMIRRQRSVFYAQLVEMLKLSWRVGTGKNYKTRVSRLISKPEHPNVRYTRHYT